MPWWRSYKEQKSVKERGTNRCVEYNRGGPTYICAGYLEFEAQRAAAAPWQCTGVLGFQF